MTQKQTYEDINATKPILDVVPSEYRDDIENLFETWNKVRSRNRMLTNYYNMHNTLKELGISIPEGMLSINCAIGWASKAVKAVSMRSVFDGFVFEGEEEPALAEIVRKNHFKSLYRAACKSSLIHGLSAFTVMRKPNSQGVKVRAYSAHQFSVLHDKDNDCVKCGIVCADVDNNGNAIKYVAHFSDAVLTITRAPNTTNWECIVEPNPLGRPMLEVLVFDRDLDRPFGHSLLTPEILGTIDKGMRDILRMEVGAEFFTYPQRYVLGAADSLFCEVPEGCEEDEDGNYIDSDGNIIMPVPSSAKKMRAYLGALLAIGRDANGDVPQVGQFAPGSADNFTRVYENDAQRLSGATDVPLNQLGVLSNNYQSSDALGAANNPLILAVETMNAENAETLEDLARMMVAVHSGTSFDNLPEAMNGVQAYFKDPSLPTISANADAWTKIGAVDKDIVGTPIWYESLGQSQAKIQRIEAQKQQTYAIQTLNAIADGLEDKTLSVEG